MWLTLAFVSASLLGLYDVSKKVALRHNAVLPVLGLTTLITSVIFAPVLVLSAVAPEQAQALGVFVREASVGEHLYILLKSAIVLSSWILGYLGMKHLPITLVGPINATRPVMVLVGAMVLFGERLNVYQWLGVLCAITSLYLLSRAGKKEGIVFTDNRWVLCVLGAAVMGAISGLYDKYLLGRLEPLLVQSWYAIYQVAIMCPLIYLLWQRARERTPLRWSWAILLIPILLSLADIAYFYALTYDEAMISVVSMIRRGSVVVSFGAGALVFGEGNLRGKALDLLLILVGMVLLYIGSTVGA